MVDDQVHCRAWHEQPTVGVLHCCLQACQAAAAKQPSLLYPHIWPNASIAETNINKGPSSNSGIKLPLAMHAHTHTHSVMLAPAQASRVRPSQVCQHQPCAAASHPPHSRCGAEIDQLCKCDRPGAAISNQTNHMGVMSLMPTAPAGLCRVGCRTMAFKSSLQTVGASADSQKLGKAAPHA